MPSWIKNKRFQQHAAVLIISLVIGGFSAIQLGQDLNYDLLNYHYDNPYSLLHNRVGKDVAIGGLESYENPIADVPGYLAIAHLKPRAAAGVLGIIQGINIWFIFEIALLLLRNIRAKESFKFLLAMLIAFLSFFGAASMSEIGGTMGDNLATLFLLPGLWLLLYSLGIQDKSSKARWLRFAAYGLAGVAIGLKLTNATYGIGLLAAGLVIHGNIRRKLKESAWHIAGLLTGALVITGYWSTKLIGMFGNPIFPFYNGIFRAKYYPPVNFVDTHWLPKNIGDAITRPFQFTHLQTVASELPFRDPRLAVAISLAIIAVLYVGISKLLGRKVYVHSWSRPQAAFGIFLAVSYLVWLKQFSYYRYLLPVEMLSLVAIALLILGLIKRFSVAAPILVAALIVITMQTQPINWSRIGWQPTYFGVTKSDFKQLENGTVLIAGRDPLGFLVPYFPGTSRTIRIDSDLSSPTQGTTAMQNLIKNAIKQRQSQGSKFFALRADEENLQAERAFNQFGYATSNCREIPTYAGQYSQFKFRLCVLTSDNK